MVKDGKEKKLLVDMHKQVMFKVDTGGRGKQRKTKYSKTSTLTDLKNIENFEYLIHSMEQLPPTQQLIEKVKPIKSKPIKAQHTQLRLNPDKSKSKIC